MAQPRTKRGGSSVAAAGIFFFGYLAIQTVVPAVCLTRDVGCLFGWTMYAGREHKLGFEVRWRDGSVSPLEDVQRKFGRPLVIGTKVDETAVLPVFLCREFPNAAAVTVKDLWTGEAEVKACPQ